MKRRSFVKNVAFTGAAAPFVLNKMNFQAVTKKLFGYAKSAEDRVLVIIRMNGGNDGLNTVIPLDAYDNLALQRSNIIVPESTILPLTTEVGLHPSMTGMRNMFMDGNLGIVQNVGYPEQNRSHFRSMDIWNSGMLDPSATTGWIGRTFDEAYPNYPVDYPSTDYPDPFAISMGYEVSATCQGLMGNFSMAIQDPFDAINLGQSSVPNDGSYYGSHMEYISTLIAQSNSYGSQVNAAANAGNTMSTLYDPNNPLAVQLQYIAQMISGGLETKVYILNINGFDTHDSQVIQGSPTTGNHANLLKMLSDAVAAFQDDLNLMGLNQRVAGMTYSEFGRQIASNASLGTDHGDAAPLFLFGACLNSPIIGSNPTIDNQVIDQKGVDMQMDFRDVYASILKDWFVVDPAEIQTLFEHTVTFYPLISACNLGIDEITDEKGNILLYPNPAYTQTTLRIETLNEWVKIEAFSLSGQRMATVWDGNLDAKEHNIPIEIRDWAAGQYRLVIQKESGNTEIALMKVK